MKTRAATQAGKDYAAAYRYKKKWLTVVTGLAAVVVFCTTYALILPAIAMEKKGTPVCSYTVHQHGEDCFDETGALLCGYADYVVHTHDAACYDEDGALICGLEEIEAHQHGPECYEEQQVLACGQEETDGHAHDESCYTPVRGALTCTEADEAHEHTDECYEWTQELACGQEEGNGAHAHTEACYVTQTVLVCEKPEIILHTHTDDCYNKDGALVCGQLEVLEHIHTAECFAAPDDGIMLLAADETGTEYTQLTDGFFLWLNVSPLAGGTEQVYGNPEWVDSDTGFDGPGITDALKYMDGSVTWYLIPIQYFVDTYSQYGYQFDPENPGDCPFEYAPNAYKAPDGRVSASYYQVTTADEEINGWYVQVQDEKNGAYGNTTIKGETVTTAYPRSNIYYTEQEAPAKVVEDTVSPSGTVINLFDYWTTTPREADVTYSNYDSGINYNHALKFKAGGLSEANAWTGTANVYQGIVNNILEPDGYPCLSGREIFGMSNGNLTSSSESLAYLFDPTVPVQVDSTDYKASYRNVTGLLQVDENGYYYYDSTQNYAEFVEENNGFTLYDTWSLTYTSNNKNTINGQFFPFDPYNSDNVSKTTSAGTDALNHFFGMTLTTRFVQKYDGYTNSTQKTQTTFEFSGDDDVWIFVDDVLVADLGGIHDPASVSINFATGDIVINKGEEYEKTKKLYDMFAAAGKADEVQWSTDTDENGRSDTFANDTYHTLKFYYLERGSYASNLSLRYNLRSYPPTGISKVNQYGEPVAGAEFAVYKADKADEADEEWNIISETPVYTGKTDAKGQMLFVDADNMPYPMDELEKMFGKYFVLKETKAPDGYRLVSDTIKLYIDDGIMMCANTYESGVWADATLQVSAPYKIKLVNNEEQVVIDDSFQQHGTIFAVVLKYTGPTKGGTVVDNELQKQENWSPLYGTAENGFTVVDVKGFEGDNLSKQFLNAVIDTAGRYVESENVFTISPQTGELTGTLNGLPGNLDTYYYKLSEDEKNKTQYTVAYYWTEASSLEGATAQNTHRVNADDTTHEFERVFGATINVPNLRNRLFVQKLDEEGSLMNGARFAMYAVAEEGEDSTVIYYIADDGTRIRLDKDEDGDNSGTGQMKDDDGTPCTYTVDDKTGTITVTITDGEENARKTYTITPRPYTLGGTTAAETLPAKVPAEEPGKTVDNPDNPSGEDGTATFTNMLPGTYYVREIAAPVGYTINPTEVMVLVDNSAVYANAGTADDGITVARGPGYIVSSLKQFASQGDIDNTLSWIFEMMRVSPESTSFKTSDFSEGPPTKWDYLEENYDGENRVLKTYLEYDPQAGNSLFNYTVNTERYTGEGKDASSVQRRLYTNVGWSYYEIYQDIAWASKHLDKNTAYTKLADKEGNLFEIANLFSRSTYIQVTDNKTRCTLEISKTVVNSQYAPDKDNQSFTFTVTLTDASGNPLTDADGNLLTDSYNYKVYDIVENIDENGQTTTTRVPATYGGEDETEIAGEIQSGGTIILKDKQVAVIEGLPVGAKYTITETGISEFATTAKEKVPKPPATDDSETNEGEANDGETDEGETNDGEANDGETNDGEAWVWKSYTYGTEKERTVSGNLYWHIEEGKDGGEDRLDSLSVVNYTNTYLPDLTIHKVEAGSTNTLSGAKFILYTEVQETAAAGTAVSARYYYHNGSWVKLSQGGPTLEDVTRVTDEKEALVYENIPDGTYFLEETEAPSGYIPLKAPITITVKDGVIGSATLDGTPITEGEKNKLSLTVENTSGYTLPNTGGPGTKMYTCAGLLLILFSVLYGNTLRRKRERRPNN